jgi:AcrR family transcriptional regulator
MGNRAEQTEKRRQAILLSSLDLFVHKGYHGTTVRDIAKRSEVSVGLLFHYFPTKQAILEELLKIAQDGLDLTETLMEQSVSPIEFFEQMTAAILQAFKDSTMAAKIFMLSNQALTSHWIPEESKASLSASTSVSETAKLIEKGQTQGSIRPGDPLSLSLAFWGAIHGVAEALVSYPQIAVPEAKWIVDMVRKHPQDDLQK